MTTFLPGRLRMRKASTGTDHEPYSDANPPESLARTELGSDPSTPVSGEAVEWTPDGATLWMKDDAGQKRLIGPTLLALPFSSQASPIVAITGAQIPFPPGTWRVMAISAYLTTPGTGTTVDFNKNGATNYSGTKLVFASGSSTPGAASSLVSTDFVGGTDRASFDIDASTGTAAGLVILLAVFRVA